MFFTMHVHWKWKRLTSGWRRQKHFSVSSPLLNAYPCFLCSRWMITGTRPKGSISSFLGVTPVRTSSCQVCSVGVLRGEGVSTNIRSGVRVLFSPIFTGSRGDVFVVRTSKPVENLRKNGLFWSRYSFVTYSIDRKPRDWGLARPAYSTSCLGRPSGDVPCAGEDMALVIDFQKSIIDYSRFIKMPLG